MLVVLKNNVVQAGLVFDVVLYILPSSANSPRLLEGIQNKMQVNASIWRNLMLLL